MIKEITEVVYGYHLTDKEFDSYHKKSLKNNDDWFLSTALLKIDGVMSVTEFPNAQKSVYVQIQTDNGVGFSNIAQRCYSTLKDITN